jgi:hypothetical protein
MSIYKRTAEELLHGKSTAPGRVRTFLLNPEQHTTPHSCTRYEWNGDLADLLTFAARALKGGSGVKVTFPSNTKLVEPRDLGDWKVWIDTSHPEREAIEEYDKLIDVTDADDFDEREAERIYEIHDSIEGAFGILNSWKELINARDWDETILNLSKIRPVGTQNSNGLIASGAESFLTIYIAIAKYLETGTIDSLLKLLGTLNHVMRRGGYKKGIITSAMSTDCDLIKDYLRVPTIEIEGSHKKGVILSEFAFNDPELIELIVESRNNESTFIEKPYKPRLNSREEDLRSPLTALTTPPWQPPVNSVGWNVCVGLLLGHKATCLIWRINLGACTIDEITSAFAQAAFDVCELHTTWRDKVPGLASYYAPLEDDRQVGLDVMGLANLLAIEGVSYLEFANALEDLLTDKTVDFTNKANQIVEAINNGYRAAKWECDNYMLSKRLPLLDRIFTVEPAQSHAYETLDRVGKTTCRGIFPPTGKIVKRTSDSQVNKRYFHGNVETDVMVGVELHERICDLWQQMMDQTGRAHGISQDSWELMDADKLQDFTKRPSKTLYYSEAANFNQRGFLAKTVQDVNMETCEIARKDECKACAG